MCVQQVQSEDGLCQRVQSVSLSSPAEGKKRVSADVAHTHTHDSLLTEAMHVIDVMEAVFSFTSRPRAHTGCVIKDPLTNVLLIKKYTHNERNNTFEKYN